MIPTLVQKWFALFGTHIITTIEGMESRAWCNAVSQTLSSRNLERLWRVPEGLKSVSVFEEFLVTKMAEEFKESVEGINGEGILSY
ncbi:hypothetical protein M5689_001967 [Euphorbia peplus]|nr:hypothetical protein M5689_001967 [Euphorbia peplus]